MDYIVGATFYSLTTFILVLITFSYFLEVIYGRSKTMLAMFIHFLTDSIIFGIISLDLLRANFGESKQPFIGLNARSFLAFISALFVLYTIWGHYFQMKAKRSLKRRIDDV